MDSCLYQIGKLVFHEKFRNRNNGKYLIDAVKEWCRKNNIHIVRVRCNTKKNETHLFYKKLNFTEIKKQKIFEVKLVEH